MKQDIHNSHTTKISIKVIELQQTQRCSKKIFMTLYKYVCMKHIYLPRYKYYECDENYQSKNSHCSIKVPRQSIYILCTTIYYNYKQTYTNMDMNLICHLA
jgi:hypothetical protein